MSLRTEIFIYYFRVLLMPDQQEPINSINNLSYKDMKNNFVPKGELLRALQKNQIFRIMRITTFLLMVCVFCSFAENTHSQNAKVNLNKSNVRLNEILTDIESQTDYLFIYNNLVNVSQKASAKAKQQPVSEVLNQILANTDIAYVMEGTHIVLSKKTSSTGLTIQQ